MKTKKIGLGTYLRKHKVALIFYVIFSLLAGLCTVAMTLLFAEVITYVTEANYRGAIWQLIFVLIAYLVRRACWLGATVIYSKYSNTIMAEIREDLIAQAFKLNSKTYASHSTGKFTQRICTDPERVLERLADFVDIIMENILPPFIIIIYVCTLNVWIGLAYLAVTIPLILLEQKRAKVYQKNRKKTHNANDKIHAMTTEIIRSEKDIKSLNLEAKLLETSRNNCRAYRKTNSKTQLTDMAFYMSRNFILEIFEVLILILGIVYVDKATITLATFMILYSYKDRLYSFVWGLGNIMTYLTDIKVYSGRMFALFEGGEYECEKFGNVTLENIRGEIEFKNVEFSFVEYEEVDENSKAKVAPKVKSVNKIFDNLSFKIEPNTNVAFVGRSGSGKSTILNLMSKLDEVDGGEVLIDGVNINDLTKENLRNTISLVNQFPYIFDMTIKDNLTLAKMDATQEEIEDVIEKSALKEFVDSLPEKLDTKVGESGIKLSGGQKQRLAIARALLRKSPIIIFDESTSSLDNFAQEDIKKTIDELKGKSTVIIVAHRLSTIKDVDKIFFLEEGKIVDSGTFNELFANNENFKNMFFAEN